MDKPEFTEAERAFLAIMGRDLPDASEPFAEAARRAGLGEDEALELVGRLKESGVIRRFGATLRHQKAGYGHNAMVAWRTDSDEQAKRAGEIMAARSEISHCYQRVVFPEWPYSLYTMVHGRDPDEVAATVESVKRATGLDDVITLRSLKELKKTSMIYFQED